MQITTESRKVRWLGLIGLWFVIACLLYWHAVAVRQNVDMLGNVGLRGAAVAPTPLHRICPTMYADAQMWVRHALALAKGDGPQLRYTHVDNAPYGREVHWDSGFAWLIVAAGYFRHLLFGENLAGGVEGALPWFNLPLLLGFVVVFTIWLDRRAGLGAAVILGMAMLGNPDFYSGFSPNYVDHHGVLAAAVLGLTLGAALMGVGFYRTGATASQILPGSARAACRAAFFSAACGALGMWVSAATLVPAIAIVGIAGGLVILLYPAKRFAAGECCLFPDVWRRWGWVGGLLTLGFYLLEYAPAHLGFRMEVNHPAYAMAWLGSGEILAQLAEWRQGKTSKTPHRGIRLAGSVIGLLSVPLIIAIGGATVFVVFDPFVARLSSHVAEGVSFFKAVTLFGWGRVWIELPWITATLVLSAVWWRSSDRNDRPIVVFCVLIFLLTLAMALKQIRWWPSAGAAEICIILLAISTTSARRAKWARRAWVLAPILLLFGPTVVYRITTQEAQNRARAVDPSDAIQPIYRDIARALRASQPEGDIVLLASPNASVAVGYYGEFKTIGTLYWENLDGTKAAAAMFSAESENEARRLLRDRGVTHVAMVSQDNFLAEYFSLLHPHSSRQDFSKSFGYQLLTQQKFPIWLEEIPYQIPPDSPTKPERILLFKTRFGSANAERAHDAAIAAMSSGNLDLAESKLREALRIEPKMLEYWVLETHLLLRRGKLKQAEAAVAEAIDCAAPSRRFPLCVAEAARFYGAHAYEGALGLYKRAIQIQYDPNVVGDAAWIMATAADDAVRDGPKALELTEGLLREHNEISFVSAFAAALAENGRFAEAVAAEERVLASVRAAKRPDLVAAAETRLSAYKAGKPWRQ